MRTRKRDGAPFCCTSPDAGAQAPDGPLVRSQPPFSGQVPAGAQQPYYTPGGQSPARAVPYGAPPGYAGSGHASSSGYAAASPAPPLQNGAQGPVQSQASGSHSSYHDPASHSGEHLHGDAHGGWPLMGVAATPPAGGHEGTPPPPAPSSTRAPDAHIGGRDSWPPPTFGQEDGAAAAHRGTNGFGVEGVPPHPADAPAAAPARLDATQLFDVHATSLQTAEAPRAAADGGAAAFGTALPRSGTGASGAAPLDGTQLFDVHAMHGQDFDARGGLGGAADSSARAFVPLGPGAETGSASAAAHVASGGSQPFDAQSRTATAQLGATQLFDVHADPIQ